MGCCNNALVSMVAAGGTHDEFSPRYCRLELQNEILHCEDYTTYSPLYCCDVYVWGFQRRCVFYTPITRRSALSSKISGPARTRARMGPARRGRGVSSRWARNAAGARGRIRAAPRSASATKRHLLLRGSGRRLFVVVAGLSF